MVASLEAEKNSRFFPRRVSLDFPPAMIEAAAGETMGYSYWRVGRDDPERLVRHATCLIPKSKEARELAWAHFSENGSPGNRTAMNEVNGMSSGTRFFSAVRSLLGPQELNAATQGVPVDPCDDTDPDTPCCEDDPNDPDCQDVEPEECDIIESMLTGCTVSDGFGGTCVGSAAGHWICQTEPPVFCMLNNDPACLNFQPPVAQLTCSPETVQRGATATCNIEDGTELDPTGILTKTISWEFTGGGVTRNASGTGKNSWAGPMVVGGTVTATVAGSTPETATLGVSPRTFWNWNPNASVQGHSTWQWGSLAGGRLGVTCWIRPPSGVCDAQYPFQPEPLPVPSTCENSASSHGWSCAPVPSGGPNSGLWYVTSASWSMHKRSGINPEFNFIRSFIPGSATCPSNSGPGTWVDYNFCRGRTNAADFVAGALAHEQGHVQQGDTEAAASNPVSAVEILFAETEQELKNAAETGLRNLATAIVDAAADEPTGNFFPGAGPWYVWQNGGYYLWSFDPTYSF